VGNRRFPVSDVGTRTRVSGVKTPRDNHLHYNGLIVLLHELYHPPVLLIGVLIPNIFIMIAYLADNRVVAPRAVGYTSCSLY
jgi:hypothetical protein